MVPCRMIEREHNEHQGVVFGTCFIPGLDKNWMNGLFGFIHGGYLETAWCPEELSPLSGTSIS